MRRALVAAVLVITCGGVLAAEKETRQQKIDRLCSEGKWEEAEPYAVAEVETAQSRYGNLYFDQRPQLLISLVRLAAIYNAQQMWESSLQVTSRAEDVAAKELTSNEFGNPKRRLPHHDALHAQINRQKGIALFGQRKYVEAQKCFESALAVASMHRRERSDAELNSDHIDTGAILVHLADTHLAQDQKAAAKPLLQRAMVIYEEKLGGNDPQTKAVQERLAKLSKPSRPKAVMAE